MEEHAHDILITKADGSQEPFDTGKLDASLRKAGASVELRERIAHALSQKLTPDLTTETIYREAFRLLKHAQKISAARYSMKRAVLEFGPSGFPFEEFIAHLFRVQGYRAQTDVEIPGACVTHEVDVLAKRAGETVFVEAKFHNTLGFKTDVKVALYVRARFEDIKNAKSAPPAQKLSSILITNTSFTEKALAYGKCAGLALLSWDYPRKGNLHDLIGQTALYPVTALTTLSREEKMALLQNNVVLCSDLARSPEELYRIGLSAGKVASVREEAELLCETREAIKLEVPTLS